MRIVFASSLIPTLPTDSGFEIANRAIVEGLLRAGHDVQLIGFALPDRELLLPTQSHSLGTLDVKTANAGTKQKLTWLLQAVRNNTTFAAAKLDLVTGAELTAKIEALAPFDVLVINGAPMAGAFFDVLARYPHVYVAHNQEAVAARQASEASASLVEKLMYRREAMQLEKLETAMAQAAAGVATFTKEDRDALFGMHANAKVLPLVTPEMTEKKGGLRPIGFDAGMVGTWTWTQNRIGLEWFLQQVMPLMPKHTQIAIAGSLPPDFPQRDKRVKFLGRVLDAKSFIRSCRVSILCARAGTGIQLKTLETMEMGLPAVATSSSLRGIPKPLPEQLVEANDPQAFADALKKMIVEVRTGRLKDGDGASFRQAQLAQMDRAIADLLAPFTKSAGS
ncbi:MAG: glycosyltransferase [Pseudomonadota bacterium]